MNSFSSPYQIDDPRFTALIQKNARLRQLATGFEWTEGPVWFADQQLLLFSDIPANRMMRLTLDGQVSTYRQPSDYANGNTRDRQGRLVSCQHGTRSVTRTELDGSLTVLADRYQGKRLNSPNDVIVQSTGAIWFTDPTYGILSDYEGFLAEPEQTARNVYRIDPATGEVEAMIADFTQPNGLAFSADERVLYVAESGSSHDPDVPSIIRAFKLDATGRILSDEVFATIDRGLPDGMRVDAAGHLWSSASDGIHCFHPDGTRLGKILVPEVVANLCFGGVRGNRLLITATTSVYEIAVNAKSAI
ncbi:putative gluconolactonase precursor [Stappia aggregata IAM 12614]|uniref:Putative gluconolactonase n=1 Tax=Roseibium aggregatum (strain ATCC 25650 / DSM 13394 / JCM 20685 / NBRC 16684 / NCIMB 2208 / IAM 12614 / B1) TaxID=384765 RepID=A0P0A6_ROSAI|nr:SMP-30/gluconolactonase/LRE family protein [Roseibium aggregatum]EAV41514.1 putative gluconolactonase precursor [Stappia aggregata IAM 12614] [Roseibium aggregatum IAM 12614]